VDPADERFNCIRRASSLLRLRERLGSIVMSISVCGSVCPRGYLGNQTRDLYLNFLSMLHVRGSVLRHVYDRLHRLSPAKDCCILVALLWSPYGIGQTIIFTFSGFFFLILSFFFSWPNLTRLRLDVCHTYTHGVALMRI